MRILHITNSLGVGGAEWILFRLASSQVEQGYEVVVINLGSDRGFRARLEQMQVKVIQLVKPSKAEKSSLFWGIALLGRAPSLYCVIKRLDPAVVHTWMYVADVYGGLIARLAGIPVIWGIFTGRVDKSLYSSVTWRLLKLSAVLSKVIPKVVVSCSAFGRRSHIEIGYDQRRVVFVPTGFSWRKKEAVRATLFLKSGKDLERSTQPLVLGMLGRISREKRHDLLLRALTIAIDKGYEVDLVLAGGVGLGPSDSPLRGLIAENSLKGRVSLLGCVDDPKEFLSRIDCFVLVSDSEGFPTVIGQAMAAGLPCIASDVGDARLLLADQTQVVRQNKPEVLAQAIINHALMDIGRREELGKRNRERLKKVFPESLMLSRYNRVYKFVIESSGKS